MKIRTPVRAIRAKCIDCCCGNVAEPKNCEITDCPLWPYRLGHRPKSSDVGGDSDGDNLEDE